MSCWGRCQARSAPANSAEALLTRRLTCRSLRHFEGAALREMWDVICRKKCGVSVRVYGWMWDVCVRVCMRVPCACSYVSASVMWLIFPPPFSGVDRVA